MAIHQYNFPTRIQFGPEAIQLLPDDPEGAGQASGR